MLVSAYDAQSTQAIVNCFRKSGISTESQVTDIAEDDNPFRKLQDKIDDLRSVQPNLLEEDFDDTTFVDVDAEVIAVQPPPSDSEVVAELLETKASVMMMMMMMMMMRMMMKQENVLIKISCCKLSRLCRGSPYF